MRTKGAAILVAIATVYVAIAAGGKAIEPVPDFDHAPARRLCAHRGFCTIAPENGMSAFGAAVVAKRVRYAEQNSAELAE